MRRWTSISFVIALVLVMVLAPVLHKSLGNAAYFIDLLVFVGGFILARYFLSKLDD